MNYYDERHMYHMKAYLIEKLGHKQREEIDAMNKAETFAEFQRVYHGGEKKETKTARNKNIWKTGAVQI